MNTAPTTLPIAQPRIVNVRRSSIGVAFLWSANDRPPQKFDALAARLQKKFGAAASAPAAVNPEA